MKQRNVGVFSELTVAMDLIKRGYDVFMSMHPNSPFDMVAHKDGKLLRVEAKTARRTQTGTLTNLCDNKGKYDVLALSILSEGVVIYYPAELLD